MFNKIKLTALGLIAASTILPVASPVNAAVLRTGEESVAEIQAEKPKEELITRRYRVRRVRRRRVYRRRPRRYRVRKIYRRPRFYRRRTCYYTRYRRVCRYRTYRRY